MRSAWFAFAATFVMAAVSLATCIYAIRVNMKRWSGDEMRSLLEAEAKHLAERVPYGIPNTMASTSFPWIPMHYGRRDLRQLSRRDEAERMAQEAFDQIHELVVAAFHT